MQLMGKYVVYDPPDHGLPYLAVLFMPGAPPKVFVFDTYGQAVRFLTDSAIGRREPAPPDCAMPIELRPLRPSRPVGSSSFRR